MRYSLLLSLLVLVPVGACQDVPAPLAGEVASDSIAGPRAPVTAARVMVVAGHPEATRVGVAVLRAGGNAVDAAVAVGFALAVVLPNAGNVGGGGFLLLRQPDGTATSFDFRETAPGAATPTMFLDAAGEVVPGLSVRGALASGVPGTVAGLLDAHDAYGRLPLDRLIEPAIALAERGFRLTRRDARLLAQFEADFLAFPSTARYFTREGGYYPGDRFVQPDLAAVLRRIRDRGKDGFYRGRTADLIVEQMEQSGGLISHADLEGYRAIERPVLVGEYHGGRVLTMGPPSGGGLALVQALHAVEGRRPGPPGSAAHVHLFAEALRRAFADRARYLADPAFVRVPAEALADSAYVARRMRSFRPDTVSDGLAAGVPELEAEGTETTHYSIVDAEGRAVAVTTTINDYFGSKLVVDGAGFFLNDEMDDFTSKPGVANLWGLEGGGPNTIAPGKRMASSMAPAILEDERGRLLMVIGSPGGARIASTVLQVATGVLDDGLDAQAAATRPRFHHQGRPVQLQVEEGFDEATLDGLRARGWLVETVSTFGAADLIVVRYDGRGGFTLEGGADPRRENDTALGY